MRISTRVVIDVESNQIIEHESYEYSGQIAQAITFGGTKSKQKSKTQSTSESGTQYNEDFLNRAIEFASGKRAETEANFDPQAYLKAHPDVAADPNYATNPYQHYIDFGKNDPSGNYKYTMKADPYAGMSPDYNPAYVGSQYATGVYTPGAYTGSSFTAVAPEGYDKLEKSLYESQQSKLRQAYDQAVARQREELAQSGALNSPSQYLEGSARSSMDRSYLTDIQQAARDAVLGRLGLEEREAGRKTAYDVGEAARRTGYDVGEAARRTGYDVGEAARQTEYSTGEAGRQTAFNEQTAARLLQLWLQKLGLAIEAGRYARGESTGTSSGDSMGGNFGFANWGTNQSS